MKLSIDEMHYIGLFEGLTGAKVRDCIVRDDSVLFVVEPGNAGKAIGRKGSNIEKASKLIQKRAEVVEYSDSLEVFIRSIFTPARISSINLVEGEDGLKKVYVVPHHDDQGLAIGRNGRNINRARMLLKRYCDIDQVIVSSSAV
ncbi:MAG: NusA-like transcription termination signal-binding factor [Thermoprotei archaeon]